MLYLHVSLLRVCTCKGKDKKPADKQWKEKMQGACEGDIKQISVIDMASIIGGRRYDKQQDKQTNKKADKARKQANKQAKKQTKCGVRGGQM